MVSCLPAAIVSCTFFSIIIFSFLLCDSHDMYTWHRNTFILGFPLKEALPVESTQVKN